MATPLSLRTPTARPESSFSRDNRELCGGFAYINRVDYEKAFRKEPVFNVLMVNTMIDDPSDQDLALSEILSSESALTAEFTSQIRATFDDLLSSIDFLVGVIIVAAGALAVIVLYNLININIEERRKELATLKVLGFHNEEVAGYIFREVSILAVIRTGVGLVLGVLLRSFVIVSAEPDFMFGRVSTEPRAPLVTWYSPA